MIRAPIDRSKLRIKPLVDPAEVAGFESGDAELDAFLARDALRLQDQRVVQVYLAVYEDVIGGYVALLADAVVLQTRERTKLRLATEDHPAVPAVKVARLAVSRPLRERTRGIGEHLMRFAVFQALAVSESVGCRLLTVDAYAGAIDFYEHLGFIENKSRSIPTNLDPSSLALIDRIRIALNLYRAPERATRHRSMRLDLRADRLQAESGR